MKKRIISTIGLWAILIILLSAFGAHAGVFLVVALSALTQLELYGMLEKTGLRPLKLEATICGAVMLILCYYLPELESFDLTSTIIALIIIGLSIIGMSGKHRHQMHTTIFPTIAGFMLVPFMFQFFVRILSNYSEAGSPNTGIFLCIWIIAVAKFTDVGGLLVGKYIGRTKLAPKLSPGKTWEGAAGGIGASVLISIILITLFRSHFPEGLSTIEAALIAIPVGAVGVLSDLMESSLKRQAQIKDSGNIIPGIGGIFDLTDSLLFSTPVAYLLLSLFC